jgi:hypothetical protein
MKLMNYLGFFLFVFLFACDIYAYEIYEGISTVTPGCEGGVLYSRTESWFSTTSRDGDSNDETFYRSEESQPDID